MRKQIFGSFVLLFALFFASTTVSAQLQTPAPSPFAKMETKVGLTDVHVEYSRPGMKGRTIFAEDGLVPFGQIWRTGANQATKITFGNDVMVAGAEVKGGSYAVLTKPMKDEWEVMFYPYETGNWGSYREKTPAATVSAKTMNVPGKVENFTIMLDEHTLDGANIYMMWDETMVALPIKTTAKEDVMASIDRIMAGPSANDYYQAASFMHSAKGDMNKALTYIQKANMMNADDPKFWQVRREALILGELGRKKEAIAKAKMSKELAMKAGNDDYVRMNEQSIKEWSRK
ncbi:dihydrolipoamide dehydrogenase [Lewinellaceae bacterium SD302]|nr:dihydrolipoamide dehydrogenase [Lewinellaceae bacterium SD302]